MKRILFTNPALFGGKHSKEREKLRRQAVESSQGIPVEITMGNTYAQQVVKTNTGDWHIETRKDYAN